jgi:hypothetical protein
MTDDTPRKVVTVRLDPRLYDRVKAFADTDRRSVNSAVNLLVELGLGTLEERS